MKDIKKYQHVIRFHDDPEFKNEQDMLDKMGDLGWKNYAVVPIAGKLAGSMRIKYYFARAKPIETPVENIDPLTQEGD